MSVLSKKDAALFYEGIAFANAGDHGSAMQRLLVFPPYWKVFSPEQLSLLHLAFAGEAEVRGDLSQAALSLDRAIHFETGSRRLVEHLKPL